MFKTTSLSFVPTGLAKTVLVLLLVALGLWPSSVPMASAQSGGPTLTISDQIAASPNSQVSVPINYTTNGASISATTYSVDYDESRLAFDDTDSDGDGIPDAVTFSPPGAFGYSVTFDGSDTDGELDFFIADTFPPLAALPDGTVASITFTVLPNASGEAAVNFSQAPAASFGNTSGQSVAGTTDDGSVLIEVVGPGEPTAEFNCTPRSGPSPLTVTCTDQSTPADQITSWLWDFGDGTTSTEQNPSHTYSADGLYAIDLTATTSDGSDTESKTNYISVSTTATTVLQVGSGNAEMYADQLISLEVSIQGAQDLYGLEVTCSIDANVASFQTAEFGDFFGPDALVGIDELTSDSLHRALSQRNPAPVLSGDGLFATITFRGIAPGTSEVVCTPLASNQDGFPLPISASNTTITVLPPPPNAIVGVATYQSRENYAGIEVTLTGPLNGSTTTIETGRFEFLNLAAGNYEVTAEAAGHLANCTNTEVIADQATVLDQTQLLAGDVDGNGVIDIFDATAVGNVFGQSPSPTASTDFNVDGIVDIFDLTPLGSNFGIERGDCDGW